MKYIVFDDSLEPSCAKCRFRNGEICVVTGEERLYQICPIRTLPERCEIKGRFDEARAYCEGWNACLKEIAKVVRR